MNDLHGIVLAYRSDNSLGELTRPRNTCSLPFGGRYRLVDFILSNYVNAGISDVGVIVHESYQSLLDHVGTGKDWDLSRKHGGLRILPPFGYTKSGNAYRGSMDALRGVQSYLENIRQEYVIIGWGDMAANLDVSDAFRQHLQTGADITMFCTPNASHAQNANYVTVNEENRVTDLSLHANLTGGMESMELYILSKQLLLEVVDHCFAHNQISFTRGVIQPRLNSLKIMSYVHTGYLARFLSVANYFDQSMNLLNPEIRNDLFNPNRPIRTKDMSTPSTYYGPDARCSSSLISDGCFVEGEVENCILSRGVRVEAGAKVSNSILMQGTVVRANASLAYVIADKNVTINAGRMLMGHQSYPLAISKNSVV